MDTNKDKILYKDLSYKIVGLAMEVHSKLGYGFLVKNGFSPKDLFNKMFCMICVNLWPFVANSTGLRKYVLSAKR